MTDPRCPHPEKWYRAVVFDVVDWSSQAEPLCRFKTCDHLMCMAARRIYEMKCVFCDEPLGEVNSYVTDGKSVSHTQCW